MSLAQLKPERQIIPFFPKQLAKSWALTPL